MRGALIALLICAFYFAGCRRSGVQARDVTLWIWERPEDLRTLDPTYDVAVLLLSVELRSGQIIVRPRMQAVRLEGKRIVTGVVRIDANPDFHLANKEQHRLSSEIARLPERFTLAGVQIDFDATVSQRSFYRDLLSGVRTKMRSDVPLSITALASWCMGDGWIRSLPIQEAVPMLFEMGPDREDIVRKLERGGDFTLELCRKSVGLSIQEAVYRIPARRRLYLFSRQGWTPETLGQAKKIKGGL